MSWTKSHLRSGSPLGRSDSRTAQDAGFHHACTAKSAAEHVRGPAGPAQPGSSDALHERLGRRSRHNPGRHADGDFGPRTSDQNVPDTIPPSGTPAPPTADEDSFQHLPRKHCLCQELCGCPDFALATLSDARLNPFQEEALLCEVSWLPSGRRGPQPPA